MKKNVITSILITAFAFALILKGKIPEQHFLSVAAIMKNEKPYLKEWLEYHILQGVEHFYLCDNDSTDGTKEYITPYIENKIITYIPLSGKNKQGECYQKIVTEYGKRTTWLAIIDLDEYIVPLQAKNIPEFLQDFSDASEVSLHWMNYGDNGAFSRSNGLVTEFFTSHARFLNHTVKSIIRPSAVKGFNVFGSNHYVPVNGKSVNEYHKPVNFMLNFNISADKARINHYITKSFAEFINKKSRGHPEGTAIDYSYYFFHNENEIKNDMSMHRFLPALKERMQKSPLPDVTLSYKENLPKGFDDFYFTPDETSLILRTPTTEMTKFYDVQKKYKKHPNPNYLSIKEKR